MVRAIVLAAGASSRMGRPKAGLPLTHRADTFVARLIRTLVTAGLPEVVVVTGAAPEAVRTAAGAVPGAVRFVHNHDWERGQLSSLLAGLRAPCEPLVEAILVCLVDAPLVSADTVRHVVHAWRTSRAVIVRPARGDVHGHPVLFDRTLFDELRRADPRHGAKPVVRAHAGEILNLPVDDPGAFLDIDTELEYREVLRGLRHG